VYSRQMFRRLSTGQGEGADQPLISAFHASDFRAGRKFIDSLVKGEGIQNQTSKCIASSDSL
jgi:hypothetical protein